MSVFLVLSFYIVKQIMKCVDKEFDLTNSHVNSDAWNSDTVLQTINKVTLLMTKTDEYQTCNINGGIAAEQNTGIHDACAYVCRPTRTHTHSHTDPPPTHTYMHTHKHTRARTYRYTHARTHARAHAKHK